MGETNKSLRIRTNVGTDKYVSVNLTSEYDTLEILSLKINQRGAYRHHINTYGVVVGRVLANNGFGVPNAKLSLFIERDDNTNIIEQVLYPYTTVSSKNNDGIRYNLLPSIKKDDCHQVVGTFPSKRMLLDDNSMLEVFDKYYMYTTRTNESGDYMFFGVPTGQHTLHMDLDISDCGKLSQRPRDLVEAGYNLEQFENPNQFKISTELSSLPQIFSQDVVVDVKAFWGDSQDKSSIGITREDINVKYTFKPTCVFMGSMVSDNPNDGINKKCIATNKMGDMRDVITGSGTIEIIRKTINNTVEELQIKGKQLIDGNGVWCFQIPMNLDYVTTDEYGNTVPTDNPDKGIATRCEVRFRVSMNGDNSENVQYKHGKVLIPNNPTHENSVDYAFGSDTRDESFKSLMWNGVYSVKSFIPRFQKSANVNTNKFTGFKNVNIHGSNNPIPFNNIRIRIPFMFWLMCNVIKLFIRIIQIINNIKVGLMKIGIGFINLPYSYIGNEVCPDLEYWYFAPGMNSTAPPNNIFRKFWSWLTGAKGTTCNSWQEESVCLTFKDIAASIDNPGGENSIGDMLYEYIGTGNEKKAHVVSASEISGIVGEKNVSNIRPVDQINTENEKPNGDYDKWENWIKVPNSAAPLDKMSTDAKNAMTNIQPKIHLTPDVDYLMQCVEMNLAQEYEVIKFDFYNDWINGMVYIPRWARSVKYKKKTKNGATEVIQRIKGCIGNYSTAARKYTQQCALIYDSQMNIKNPVGCNGNSDKLQCHKKQGMQYVSVLGQNGGIVHEEETMLHDFVYYMKPRDGQVLMFATDIIMLGSLFDCNEYGISSVFESLVDTTYKLPTNLAMTNTDQDSYAYLDRSGYLTPENPQPGPPTISTINAMQCNTASGCALKHLAASGVTATIPSYDDLSEMMYARGEIQENSQIVIEYDDIFPVTEMAGIEWGYKGPEFDKKNNSDNKLFSPGGHFMGLACGNAETNIKSCVNLQRACEIGTSYSERFEIPMGFSNKSSEYDVVNYLYVAPNGVIGKDQVVDVTFRSVFATLNQNALQTEVDPTTKHKKYKFQYLIPDNFDNTIEKIISDKNMVSYNTQIQLEWDNYWSKVTPNDMKGMKNAAEMFNSELQIEQGYTITRLLDASANDYLNFRYGDTNPRNMGFLLNFGSTFSMPQYKNSFYFYFGLKKGSTALDEFRKQFFASCAKSSIVGDRNKIEYDYVQSNGGFRYDVTIKTPKIKLPLSYTLKGVDNNRLYSLENVNNDVFIIRDVVIGVYNLTVTDADGEDFFETLEIGVDDFIVDYDTTSIQHYESAEERGTIDDFVNDKTNGGCISGTFNVTEVYQNGLGFTYKACIKHGETNVEVGDENWNKLYDSKTNTFWCYGFGTYEVYIREYRNSNLRGERERKYGEFEIKDGKPEVIFKLGTVNYFDENDISNFNVKTIKDAVYLDSYEKYKTITSPYKMGEALFNLAFSYESKKGDYEGIYAGKPEKISGNENDEDLYEGLCLTTDVPNGYMLHFDSLRYPSDWKDRGDFYFTAYLDGNFATTTQEFNIESEVDAVGEPTGKRIVNVELEKNGVYCLVAGFEKKLIIITDDNKNQQVYVNVDSSIEKAYVGEMVNASWFSYPFSFEMIKILDTVTDDYKLIGIPQAYQNKVERIYEGTTLYLYEYTNELTLAETNRKLRLTVPNWGEDNFLKLRYSHVSGDDNVKLRIYGLNDSLPLSGNTNYKFYLHVSDVEFESDFDVTESSDFDISVGYTEDENGRYRFDEPIFFEGKEVVVEGEGDIVYDSSEIHEKIVYWGYENNCLTLYGLGKAADENTGDDVYDENNNLIYDDNTIVYNRWVYRGVITVDGKQYDKWEDIADAYYNCYLTKRIVKRKEIEGSLKNTETCFTYNKTFKEGVDPTYEILNAIEMTHRYEGTSLIVETEIPLANITNKKIWSFATYVIERGNKNNNYRLNDYKKVQAVKIFNNCIDNFIVTEKPEFHLFNPYAMDERITEYQIYTRDSRGKFYGNSGGYYQKDEKEFLIVFEDSQELTIQYGLNINSYRFNEVVSHQITLLDNGEYNYIPLLTKFDSKDICFAVNELGNTISNYVVRFLSNSPVKVISKTPDSDIWVEEENLGVAIARPKDMEASRTFLGSIMSSKYVSIPLSTEELIADGDYQFIIYYKN